MPNPTIRTAPAKATIVRLIFSEKINPRQARKSNVDSTMPIMAAPSLDIANWIVWPRQYQHARPIRPAFHLLLQPVSQEAYVAALEHKHAISHNLLQLQSLAALTWKLVALINMVLDVLSQLPQNRVRNLRRK